MVIKWCRFYRHRSGRHTCIGLQIYNIPAKGIPSLIIYLDTFPCNVRPLSNIVGDKLCTTQSTEFNVLICNQEWWMGIHRYLSPFINCRYPLAPTIPFQEYVCWNSFCNGWLAKRGRFQMIWSMLIFDQQQMTPFNVTWPQCQLLNWTCVMYLLKALGMNAWVTLTVIDDSPELIFKLSKNLYELWRSCYFPTLPIYIRQWWPAAVDLQHRKSFLSRNNSCLLLY